MGLSGGALALVGGPTAPVHRPAPGVLVQFEDVGHRPLQEGSVVGDDDHAPATPGHDVLQPRQPVEVEIVRGLVEEGQVEARQQDGGEGDLGLLPTRKGGHGLRRHAGWERHLGAGADQAGLEVPGRDGLVAREGDGVALLGLRPLGSEAGGGRRQLRLDARHACAAGEGCGDGLVTAARVLLAQVPDGGGGRLHPDLAGRWDEQAGQDLEQRRLADPVRADDAETGGGSD